jgi:predicted CxxxxCH...CXXCH cytochrome family protein
MRPKTIAIAFFVASLSGCAELKDDLPPPTGGEVQVHPDGYADSASAVFHGNTIRDAGWDMRECQTCHGSDYGGGVAEQSCLTCHTNISGPENCATCHGSTNPAPPRDLAENESTDLPGVGAHQVHLLGGNTVSGTNVPCSQCHVVPASVYVPGHVDTGLPAEVMMVNGLAEADPTPPGGSPSYDSQASTCANTYCHGNWSLTKASSPNQFAYTADEMSGANYSPLWTGGEDEIACATCHASPPTGHIAATLSECGGCHSNIVDPDGTIADTDLHINGKVNVFGTERPF